MPQGATFYRPKPQSGLEHLGQVVDALFLSPQDLPTISLPETSALQHDMPYAWPTMALQEEGRLTLHRRADAALELSGVSDAFTPVLVRVLVVLLGERLADLFGCQPTSV